MRQALPAGEVAPRSWWEVVERCGRTDRGLVDAAFDAPKELLGERPCEDGTQLFKVETLTLAECAIATRIDLTHAEKIEHIRPLRDKRRAAGEAAQTRADARPYKPSKAELEHQEYEKRQAAEETALSPEEREQRQRNREANDAWLKSLMASSLAVLCGSRNDDAEDDYGVMPSELFPSSATKAPIDAIEPTMVTDEDRSWAADLRIKLD